MMRVEVIDPLVDPRWGEVAALPQATLYHSMAWSYDLVAATVSLGRWKDWGKSAARSSM